MALNAATLRQRVVEIVSHTEQRLRTTSMAAGEVDPLMDPTKATIYNELSFKRLLEHFERLSRGWETTATEVISQLHMLVGVFPVEAAEESEALAKLLDATSIGDEYARHGAPIATAHTGTAMKLLPNAPAVTLLEQRYRDLAREHHEQSSQLEYCEAKLRRREMVLQYVQNAYLHEVVSLSEQVIALTGGGTSGKNARASGVNMSVLRGTFSLLDWLEVLELLFDPRCSDAKNKSRDAMAVLEDIRDRRRRGDVTNLVDARDAEATAAAAFNTFKQLHEYKEVQLALQEREEKARDTIARLKADYELKAQALQQMSTRHTNETLKLRSQISELQAENKLLCNDIEFAERRIQELENNIRQKQNEVELSRIALEEQNAQTNLSHLTGLSQDAESKNAAAAEAAKLALERQRIYGLLDKILSGGAVSRADIMASLNEDDPATAGFLRGAEEMKTREADFETMKEEVERLKEDLAEMTAAKEAGDTAISATIDYFHTQGLRVPRSVRHLYPDDADDGFDTLAEVDWCAEAKALEQQVEALRKDAAALIATIATANDEFPPKLRIQTYQFDASIDDPTMALESSLTTPRGNEDAAGLHQASLGMSQGSDAAASPMIIQNAARRASSVVVPQALLPPALPRRASVAGSQTSTGTGSVIAPATLASATVTLSDLLSMLRMRIAYDTETMARSKTIHDRLVKQCSDARDLTRHLMEQLTAARSENQTLKGQATATQSELGEMKAELGDVMIELDNARRRIAELTQHAATIDAKRAAVELALVESEASRPPPSKPVTTIAPPPPPKPETEDSETQTEAEMSAAPAKPSPTPCLEGSTQTDPVAFPTTTTPAEDMGHSRSDDRMLLSSGHAAASSSSAASAGGSKVRRKSMAPPSSRGHDDGPSASPPPNTSTTLPSAKQPTVKPATRRSVTTLRTQAAAHSSTVEAPDDSPAADSDEDPSSVTSPPPQSLPASTPQNSSLTAATKGGGGDKSNGNAIPKDVIDKLWAAIDAAGSKEPKSATPAASSKNEPTWKTARTVCVSCGSSVAVASAVPMNRRVIATMTAAMGTPGDHGNSGSGGNGSHVRFTALPKGPNSSGATTGFRGVVSNVSSQCDMDAEEGLLVVQDGDGDDDGFGNTGDVSSVPRTRGGKQQGRSRRTKNACVQTCGWANLTPAQDYAVVLSRPDSSKLTLAALKRHHRTTGAEQQLHQLNGDDVEGEVAPYDPRIDAQFEAMLATDGDFNEKRALDIKRSHPATLQQRQFSRTINSIVNRGKRMLSSFAPPPPSSVAESSTIGEIAQAVNALDPVTWEAEGPSTIPVGGKHATPAFNAEHVTSSAFDQSKTSLSQLPIFRGGAPPMPKRVPSASRPQSREQPVRRANTPDLTVRPSSVDTTVDRRTSLVRPPSGAAIAAAKQKVLMMNERT